MGLFGKKKVSAEDMALNNHLRVILEFNQEAGTWNELPADIPADVVTKVTNARNVMFEYMRQLREAQVYSNGAVKKFASEEYPWIDKDNLATLQSLSQFF